MRRCGRPIGAARGARASTNSCKQDGLGLTEFSALSGQGVALTAMSDRVKTAPGTRWLVDGPDTRPMVVELHSSP